MRRFLIAGFLGFVFPALAVTISQDFSVAVAPLAKAATVSRSLAIQVMAAQAPTAVSFAPAGPAAVSDTAAAGTVVAGVLVTTNDGQPFVGNLAITSASVPGMVSLSATKIPANIVVSSVTPSNDGAQSVTVSACDAGGANCVAGTLGMNVSPAPPPSALLPLDRDATANWKKAGLLSIGGIPNRTTQCVPTVNPRGSGLDDTANIQTAINACPAGQVVQLSAGTFTIAEGNYILLNKGITLRGLGPGQTILSRPTGGCPPSAGQGATMNCPSGGNNPSEMIHISPVGRFVGNSLTPCALTSDVAAGSYQVSVSSGCASIFAAGQFVVLDELSGAQWMPDPENPDYPIWASSDYRVAYHMHNPYLSGDDGTDVFSAYTLNSDRVTNEIKQIASVSGNTITFDSPALISYRVSHTADLWKFTTPFLQMAGVEGLATEYADNGSIEMSYCAYCWLYQVETRYYIGPSIALFSSFRPQLEQFYVHEAAWPVPGGAGYNIDLRYDTSEALIENGISVLANKVMVARGSGAGSVIAYNYVDKGYITGSCCWQEIGLNASHLVGPHHILFEGNWTFNMDSDATHGGSIYMTYFRNQSTAIRSTFVGLSGATYNDSAHNCGTSDYSGSPLRAAAAQAYSYWFSFVGNVLGTFGCTTQANGFPLNGVWNGPDFSNGIFLLGWWPDGTGVNDPSVATIYPATPPGVNGTNSSCTTSGTNCATILDGNYDYFRNQIIWASNDTSHTLPNSLYLLGKPAFFNAGSGYTWPWVDPIGTTKAYSLPAKARYDAGTPFVQP